MATNNLPSLHPWLPGENVGNGYYLGLYSLIYKHRKQKFNTPTDFEIIHYFTYAYTLCIKNRR